MSNILISSRIFVPESLVDIDDLNKHYVLQNYQQATCNRCEIFKAGDRHSEQCNVCPAYKGEISLWRTKRYKNTNYIALPPGNPRQIKKLLNLDLSKALDKRPEIPFAQSIKFIGKLYRGGMVNGRITVDQLSIANDWLRRKGGIIKCPPRTGKSIIATYIACQLGVKTIIIANKFRLLKQFLWAFRGGKRHPAFTNAKTIEQKIHRPIVGVVNKMADFAKLDIAIVNYQKFIRPQSIKRVAKYINNRYSFVIIDEIHGGGALQYAKFIARLNCKFRLGLSATPQRKDGMHRLINEYVGPIVATSETKELVPNIEIIETGITAKYDYRTWVYAMKFLAGNKQRNKIIVRQVFKDLREGHRGIIIPVDFIKEGQNLVELINKQADFNNENRQEDWPEETAVFFSASIKNIELRESILDKFDQGHYKVLVAIRSMIKEGVDLANPTALYCVVPMSGSSEAGAPLFQQLSYRIATYVANKYPPVVRIFIDNIPQSFGCFKSLWWKELLPGLRGDTARYKVNKETFARAMQIAKNKEYVLQNQNNNARIRF